MVAVLVVQTAIDDVIYVIAVWDGFVSAVFAVNVSCAFGGGNAAIWVVGVYFQNVFIVMFAVWMMQMAVM